MISCVAIACLLGAAVAAPSAGGYGGYGYGPALATTAVVGSVQVPQYNFNYAVNDPLTGDNKAQTEVRDGGVVKGSYSLAEADGTIRVVEYSADDVSGFNAVVKRIGPAAHPQQVIAAPVIAAPVVKEVVQPLIAKEIVNPYLLQDINLGLNNLGLSGWGLNGLGKGLELNGLNGYNLNGLGLGGYGGWGHH
ncbi:larval cuticle protein A3A [Plutella xylostella]|uniref:larval cuticle protein A3A n=1 Tax=Plutella xylostella TaxID=51655 RepID=UPI002032BB1B|nr:larval cuticle protein A3A [Plutella xylostella]